MIQAGKKLFTQGNTILFLILACSFLLNNFNNNFSFGYHFDEPKKIKFIEQKGHDFQHPLLMTKTVEWANRVFGFDTKQEIVRLGRFFSAFWLTLMILFLYYLLRCFLGQFETLTVCALTAVSPIIVVHAHYFKEDAALVCFLMAGLLGLFHYSEKATSKTALLLGLATGCAVSSKYIGFLIIPLYLLTPMIAPVQDRARYYRFLALSLGVAGCVFAALNYSMICNSEMVKGAAGYTVRQIIEGNAVRIYPWHFFLTFHLRYSLWPGLTGLVCTLFLIGFLQSISQWKKICWQERILLSYIIIFYLIPENAPLKAFPDFMRYMLPIVPLCIYFAFKGAQEISGIFKPKSRKIIHKVLIGLMILISLTHTVLLVYHLDQDTREKAKAWLMQAPEKSMCERYVFTYDLIKSLAQYDVSQWQQMGFRYLVASSFQYERYLLAGQLSGQEEEVYRYEKRYRELFSYPYEEIKPAFKSFAFSNPAIRIIDLKGESAP